MTKSALTNTAGKAKINICVACFLKVYQSEFKAHSKTSGGKKINNKP